MTVKEIIERLRKEGLAVMVVEWTHRHTWDVMLVDYENVVYIGVEDYKTREEAILAAWKQFQGER